MAWEGGLRRKNMLARLRTKQFMATALMALMLLGLAATLWADEAPAPGAAAPAAAAASAPPKPDPSGTATGTIGDVPAKEAGKPTLLEVAEAPLQPGPAPWPPASVS